MKRRKSTAVYRRKADNRGVALMVAVVIIGILMVFTFSLLLVTYTLYSSQNKKAASLRNAEAANTLSQAITTELEKGEDLPAAELWRYLRFNICQDGTWPYYYPGASYIGHDEKAAFRYFNLNYNYVTRYFGEASKKADTPEGEDYDPPGGMEGFPGSVKLCVYWRLPAEKEADYETVEAKPSEIQKSKLRLYVEVICETASQSYVVKNCYTLTVATYDTGDKEQRQKKAALASYAGGDAFGTDPNPYNPTQIPLTELYPDEKWTWSFVSRE